MLRRTEPGGFGADEASAPLRSRIFSFYLSLSDLVVFFAGFEVFFWGFSSWFCAAGGLARGAGASECCSGRTSGLGVAAAAGAVLGRLLTGAAFTGTPAGRTFAGRLACMFLTAPG